ncbi:hypothetical protein C8T65DRAFT_2129 [Cerioporus squamosus]|nr:hypothetical protein C8T65DRAFT_2129 [Cerioporus squamosus]
MLIEAHMHCSCPASPRTPPPQQPRTQQPPRHRPQRLGRTRRPGSVLTARHTVSIPPTSLSLLSRRRGAVRTLPLHSSSSNFAAGTPGDSHSRRPASQVARTSHPSHYGAAAGSLSLCLVSRRASVSLQASPPSSNPKLCSHCPWLYARRTLHREVLVLLWLAVAPLWAALLPSTYCGPQSKKGYPPGQTGICRRPSEPSVSRGMLACTNPSPKACKLLHSTTGNDMSFSWKYNGQ